MEILPGMEIVDLGLYIRRLNALVISDIHFGYEEELSKRGIFVPRFHFRDVLERLEHLFKLLEPVIASPGFYQQASAAAKGKLSSIVVNGDLKHEFGIISNQEWRDILKFFDILSAHADSIVLVKGNHDPALGPVARKRNLAVVEDYAPGHGIFIAHGHRIPKSPDFKAAKTLIIGNEHPAISFRDGARCETFKCFLRGRFGRKQMIVVPSFNPLTVGTDILKEQFISPFLAEAEGGVAKFDVFVVADATVYPFGKVKNISKMTAAAAAAAKPS